MRTRVLIAATAWAALLGGVWSCASDRAGGSPRGASARVGASSSFVAVRMELHPLTRVVRDPASETVRIEAHVELLDAWGDTVKDVGEFQFELFRGTGDVGSMTQELVWRKDISSPEASSRQYDAITRTYVVPLLEAPDWLRQGGRATLVATFTATDGRRLVATRRIE